MFPAVVLMMVALVSSVALWRMITPDLSEKQQAKPVPVPTEEEEQRQARQ